MMPIYLLYLTIFNLDTLDLSHVQFSKEMSTYYSGKLMNQLIHIRNSETGKLRFFSKILATFEIQKYLIFNINRYVRSFLANHRSFMTSLNIPSGKESEDLAYLYWMPKLHKTPYKERYIAGSSKNCLFT